MTAITAPTPARRRLGTGVAAVDYALAWVVGLSVAASSTEVRSTGVQVLAALQGHRPQAFAQYVITEGVTTVLLLAALVPVWRRSAPTAALLLAAVVAAAECVLGVALATSVHTPDTAESVNAAINRLDGVKMLALAVALGLAVRWYDGWRTWLLGATSAALVVSGIGYLLLSDALAYAAWVSLPLLIGCVLVLGLMGRTHR